MAYTSIKAIRFTIKNSINYTCDGEKALCHDKLENSIDYTFNRDKTETTLFESAVNCDKDSAYADMLAVKTHFGKLDGVQGYHMIQSFAGGEVTPELAHKIAGEFVEKLLGNGSQAVYSTHLNTGNIHNHVVWNSVSKLDGYKYRSNSKSYYQDIRRVSDELCGEYDLSIITPESGSKGKSYSEWQAEKHGEPTWRDMVRKAADEAIGNSFTFQQFVSNLQSEGFEIKSGKRMSVRPPGKERFVRLDRLGDGYSEAEIRQKIIDRTLQQYEHQLERQFEQQPVRRYSRSILNRSSLKSVFTFRGLRGLYFHYLYRMGVLPKRRNNTKEMPFILRVDIRLLDKRIRMNNYLHRQGIETVEQLHAREAALCEQIAPLLAERKRLYKAAGAMERIGQINAELKPIWAEIYLCRDIGKHSTDIRKKLNALAELGRQVKSVRTIAPGRENKRGSI